MLCPFEKTDRGVWQSTRQPQWHNVLRLDMRKMLQRVGHLQRVLEQTAPIRVVVVLGRKGTAKRTATA